MTVPARAALDAAITEKQFLQQVKDLARLRGWQTYHNLNARGSDPGFPDLVLVRDGRLLFIELKTEKGRISPVQDIWLKRLREVGTVRAFLWRPHDWPEIEARLTVNRREL